MAIDDKIREGKLQYDVSREAAKTSALSSGKINKYEFTTCEDISSSDQSRILEKAMLTCSPPGKEFERKPNN